MDKETHKNMDTTSSSSDSDCTSSSSDSDASTLPDQLGSRKLLTEATKFSVTSSDKSGLKMKIAAVPRNLCATKKSVDNSSLQRKTQIKKKVKNGTKNIISDAFSSSSCCSACNGSESDSSSDENTNIKWKKSSKKNKKSRSTKARSNKCASSSSEDQTMSTDSNSNHKLTHESHRNSEVSENFASMLPTELQQGSNVPSSKCIVKQITASLSNITSSHSSADNTSKIIAAMKPNKIVSITDVCPDGGSSSDMELPEIVNAAIKLVENCSDNEVSGKPTTSLVQYNSPLLLDFMVKTQMLGATSISLPENMPEKTDTTITQTENEENNDICYRKLEMKDQTVRTLTNQTVSTSTGKNEQENTQIISEIVEKRRRGRPKKQPLVNSEISISQNNSTAAVHTSGSPDSGILSITQSPSQSPNTEGKRGGHAKKNIASSDSKKNLTSSLAASTLNKQTLLPSKELSKINIQNLEKTMYATERVLYPPRGRRHGTGKLSNKLRNSKKEEAIDPAWNKIDINKRFRRPSISGYKSDGGTVCSKVLASQSGYTSDYAGVRRNRLSGYRSDYSKKSGYRSDYSIKAKSCGYRSDCSIRHRKKVRRKRRMKLSGNQKSAVTDQDILQLAGLSLGQSSEENSLDTQPTPSRNSENIFNSSLLNYSCDGRKLYINPVAISNLHIQKGHMKKPDMINQTSMRTVYTESFNYLSSKKSMEDINTAESNKKIANFESKTRCMTPLESMSSVKSKTNSENNEEIYSFGALLENHEEKISDTTCLKPPLKAAAIRSRRSSAVSRCSSRSTMSRHYLKRRRKKRLRSRNESCRLIDSNFLLELDKIITSFEESCHISGNGQKHIVKEKDYEAPYQKTNLKRVTKKRKVSDVAVSPSTNTSGSKRRHKKAQSDQSPDDHKLPLKKRHYLLTPGEKNENRFLEDESEIDEAEKTIPRAVTPKKRHFTQKLEQHQASNRDILTPSIKSSNSPITIDTSTMGSYELGLSDPGSTHKNRRSDTITRKKNRLEGLVSKMHTPSSGNQIENSSICSSLTFPPPPPGVFEPSIDVELQIPVSTIVIPSLITKTEVQDSPRIVDTLITTNAPAIKKSEKVVELLLNKTTAQVGKRKRKKTINRTGFPSVKKRKKISRDNLSELSVNKSVNRNQVQPLTMENVKKISRYSHRIPSDGETTDIFMDGRRPRLSVVSLEKLQGKIPEESLNSSAQCSLSPANSNRKTQKSENKTNIEQKASRQLRTRGNENQHNNKKTRLDARKNEKTSIKAGMLNKDITLNSRDQLSDNEPLINFIRSNGPKGARRKSSTLIDNLARNKMLPHSAKRTRLQSEIQKKNKLESVMQPIVKLESMEEPSKFFLPKKANTKLQSTAVLSTRSAKPKSRMELKISPLSISRDTSSEIVKEIAREIEKDLSPQFSPKMQCKNASKDLKHFKKSASRIPNTEKSTSEKNSAKENIQINLKNSNDHSALLTRQTSKEICKKSSKIIARKYSINTKTDEAENSQKRKRASSIELLLNCEDSLRCKLNSNEKQNATLETHIDCPQNVIERETNGKDIVKSRTRNIFNQYIDKKTTESKDKILSKRQKINEITDTGTDDQTSKFIETLRVQEHVFHQDINLPKLSVTNNTTENKCIHQSKINKNSIQICNTDDTHIEEELEQEPLPDNEGSILSLQQDEFSDSLQSDKLPRKISRWKKKQLTAGLLSDTFKKNEFDRKHCKTEDTVTQSLLPPPPYCERFFRRTQKDFLLPYDLWWAHENDKLPYRNTIPSWNYKKIRTNVYIDVKANPRPEPSCSCKPDSKCGEDCLNRVVYTECNIDTCPCGDKCQNTKIQKHEYAPGLEKFMTINKGWGVRTKSPIKKGTFIIEYVGEVVTEKEFKERMATLYVRDTHHYCLHLDGGLVIDGHRMGSDGRFVNHSCAPNCEMQKWSVNGLPRMVLFAANDIKSGEELTYDYNFALFNPAEGQPCFCGSSSCRGVIGGKSQRIRPIEIQKVIEPKTAPQDETPSRGRSRKRTAKKSQFQNTGKDYSGTHLLHVPSNKEQIIIKESHCFLLRNLGKIRRLRDRLIQNAPVPAPSPIHLFTRITEVRSPRNIRTRGLTVGDHDPEIDKMAKMAAIFKDLCNDICSLKEAGSNSVINKLMLPSKKKLPEYYEKVIKPIDIGQIEANVERGVYKNPATFDDDIQRLFNNAILFYPPTSDEVKAAQSLMTLFTNKKQLVYEQLLLLVNDKETLKGYVRSKVNELVLKAEPNEDVIQCICGLYKDEGLMIQCSDCQVWQHTECTKANTEIENYKCEKCDPRPVDLEIPLDEFTDEGYRYYITLLRGNLQVRQSDTVYVLRDIPMSPDPNNPNQPPQKHTYKTIGEIDYSEFDIFRVERLWKDNDGKRFVFGHQYLKPHETYHEPTRKFYPNEVVRVPLYEVVPIELIMGRCWVLDPTTYCKGRPVDCDEKHVYICELRVDKSARLFSKISKQAYPTCVKSYAFRKFEQKLKISRTYAPHNIQPTKSTLEKKPKKRKEDAFPIISRKNSTSIIQLMPPPVKTLNEKRNRLEEILTCLTNRLKNMNAECLPPMDLSYLLTGRGARQRRANATSVPV